MKELCCVGHITLDKIITPLATNYMPGGTSFYFSKGISQLGAAGEYVMVTRVGQSEMSTVDSLRTEGIEAKARPCNNSVFFENKYGQNQNERSQRVLAKAEPFGIEDMEGVEAKVVHLGSLLSDDFSLDFIKWLSTKATISLDVQGFLREVRGDKVFAVDWNGKMDVLPYIDILKLNEYEMDVLTGCTNAKDAARQLARWGIKEVVLTLGSEGSLIYADDEFCEIPAYRPKAVVDATGCGDTYMTGYLHARVKGASRREAGMFAAAMSTLKLEAPGPFARAEDDVVEVIRKGL